MLIWVIDYDKKVKWPCNDLIVANKWYHYLTDIKGHECSITNFEYDLEPLNSVNFMTLLNLCYTKIKIKTKGVSSYN